MDHQFLKNKRILLVDDEPELLQMVQTILRQEGYTNVYPASCVREALETARQVHPEMAVLDVMLPDGDGFSLMKKLREQGIIRSCFSPPGARRKTNSPDSAWEPTTIW